MPCDIGLRNVVRVKVEAPVPKNLRIRVKPEEMDNDLLEKLGEEDNEFLEWLGDLDTKPILEEALKRALSFLGFSKGDASFTKNGYLGISGKYTTQSEKRNIEKRAEAIGKRFQVETLSAIAQVLGYETKIVSSANGAVKIEGEREGDLGAHKYLAITKDTDGAGDLRFEHFATKKELRSETSKLLALAGKFGVKIVVDEVEEAGTESGKISVPNPTKERS